MPLSDFFTYYHVVHEVIPRYYFSGPTVNSASRISSLLLSVVIGIEKDHDIQLFTLPFQDKS